MRLERSSQFRSWAPWFGNNAQQDVKICIYIATPSKLPDAFNWMLKNLASIYFRCQLTNCMHLKVSEGCMCGAAYGYGARHLVVTRNENDAAAQKTYRALSHSVKRLNWPGTNWSNEA